MHHSFFSLYPFTLPHTHISYLASAKPYHSFLTPEHILTLVPLNDGLKHRPRSCWEILYLCSELRLAQVWLQSAMEEDDTYTLEDQEVRWSAVYVSSVCGIRAVLRMQGREAKEQRRINWDTTSPKYAKLTNQHLDIYLPLSYMPICLSAFLLSTGPSNPTPIYLPISPFH